MVGVPGRSNACATCRRRRKKCDGKRPICGGCIRGDHECGGYYRDSIFVQSECAGKSGVYKPADAPHWHGNGPDMPTSMALFDVRSRSLNRGALEHGLLDEFWKLWVPKLERDRHASDWLDIAGSLAPQSEMFRRALLAMTMSKVGQFQKDRTMIKDGMELYGAALRKVVVALKRPEQARRLDVLATCKVLMLYQHLNLTSHSFETSAQTTFGHLAGIHKLLEHHDPDLFSTDIGHKIFVPVRYVTAVSGLITRKASFLASPQWMIRPWIGRTKDGIDTLADMLVMIPGLWQEFDSLLAAPSHPKTNARLDMLIHRCHAIDRGISLWYRGLADFMISKIPKLSPKEIEILLGCIGQAPSVDVFPIAKRLGLHGISPVVMYIATSMIFYGGLRNICRHFPEAASMHYSAPYPDWWDGQQFSLCAIDYLKYLLHADLGLYNAFIMSFVFSVVCSNQLLREHELGYSPEKAKVHAEIQRATDDLKSLQGGLWIRSFLYNVERWC